MKKSTQPFLFKISFLLLLHLFLLSSSGNVNAQSIFDANFANFDFLASNKIHKVGTDGSAAGNITLYTNVITISSQKIDCIVHTVSLSGGTFTLPGGAPGGTIPFDYSSATGTGMSANQDRFFSPTFNWTAAGSCRFRFEFILGGSYNNATNKGTDVILKNVYVNTYDIDGNGSANSNQNNEFESFNTLQYVVGGTGNLSASYNATTEFTRLRSNSTTNTVVVVDDATRLKVGYAALSYIDIIVGADGGGAAYYFLDFGQGPAWTITPGIITSPVLDLNTITAGLNNSTISCNGMRNFTAGATNISGSSNSVNELEMLFPVSDIRDGNKEFLIPKIPSLTTDSIKLGNLFSGSQTISINSVTYKITKSVGGGTDTMRVNPASGTFTTAQVETFLDSLRYINTKLSPTSGIRNFRLTMRENFIKSVPVNFQVNVDCALLPVSWLSFTATKKNNLTVDLKWSIAQETNTLDYLVQRSTNGTLWNSLAVIPAAGNSNTVSNYSYVDLTPSGDKNYYRLLQRDIDGNNSFSDVKQVTFSNANPVIKIITNPVINGTLQLELSNAAMVSIINSNGQIVLNQKLTGGVQNIDVRKYSSGLYLLKAEKTTLKFLVQ